MRYAELDSNGKVIRVLVAESKEWCETNLGGTWVHTEKYAETEEQYAGIGMGYDETFPEKFAQPWVMPAPDPVTGEWSSYAKGAVVFHDGHLWKSTTANNVWTPGVSAWHPEPEIEGVRPTWIAPTGSHDTWAEGVEVEHDGRYFRSGIPNNATIPGDPSSGPPWNYWVEIDVDGEVIEPPEPEPDECPAWKPWDGHNSSLYQVGDCVTHNGQEWVATTGNNHWEPGVFGWALK
jgi:hypothetical protein